MSELFNSPFEFQLRILLLAVVSPFPLSQDMIIAADFITVYGKEFNLSSENLHGDNPYKFGEIAARREIIPIALQQLVLNGMLTVNCETGYQYQITETGRSYIDGLSSYYSKIYRKTAINTFDYIDNRTEQDLMRDIQRRAKKSKLGGAS